MKNLHEVDGAEMLGILIRKLTENWEKLCDEFLEEGEARPDFRVLPMTQYFKWLRPNFTNICKLIGCDDEKIIADEAIDLACGQIDDSVLLGHQILDDLIIKCNDDDDAAEYRKAYTIIAEHLATMMVDIRVPELLLDHLYLCQKICIGRYLYEIRNIITDDAVTGADMFLKLGKCLAISQTEGMMISDSDPLTRFEVVTYDREAIKYVGVDLDHIRAMFDSYNKAIKKSRTFYVSDEIYNS